MKKDSKALTIPSKPKQKCVEYNVRIGNHLYQRITRHLLLLKQLKSSESKQKWVHEAIKEKLVSDECSDERFLHLKLDLDLWNALEKKVESLKSSRRSVSKKVLIEEAIFEKLDREEHKSKALLKYMLTLSSEE